jgi:hypothetical protein
VGEKRKKLKKKSFLCVFNDPFKQTLFFGGSLVGLLVVLVGGPTEKKSKNQTIKNVIMHVLCMF